MLLCHDMEHGRESGGTADTSDLGSDALGRGGSSPPSRTIADYAPKKAIFPSFLGGAGGTKELSL